MPKRVYLRKYQNNNKQSKAYGKTYGRVKHLGTVTTDELAKHIAGHGSLLTEDVTALCLKKLKKCILEQLQEGYKVKLDGLGTFFLSTSTTGEQDEDDFTVSKNLKTVRIGFAPDLSKGADWNSKEVQATTMFTTTNPLADGPVADGDGGGGGDDGSGDDTPGEDRP